MRQQRNNDDDRRLWVLNDEGLYCQWQQSGKPLRSWIRENRDFIDECSGNVTSGKKPAHYMRYGG